jgi:hypothetical protein
VNRARACARKVGIRKAPGFLAVGLFSFHAQLSMSEQPNSRLADQQSAATCPLDLHSWIERYVRWIAEQHPDKSGADSASSSRITRAKHSISSG